MSRPAKQQFSKSPTKSGSSTLAIDQTHDIHSYRLTDHGPVGGSYLRAQQQDIRADA